MIREIIWILAAVGITSALWQLRWKRQERRIRELTMYLMKLQDGLQLSPLAADSEGELGILQSEIYKAVAVLGEQSQQARRERGYLAGMLSDISHQIKTPLAAILLMADLLKNPQLDEQKRMEFVENIDTQASKITWLIRNLLALSQLEADVLKLKMEPTGIGALFAKVCAPFLAQAEQKGVHLCVEDAGEIRVCCDEAWTAEALGNIVKNCLEHTDAGGEVRLCAAQNNFCTVLTISDNGSGIEKEDLPHIFERFYKGKYASRDSVGIGLAMAKQVILQQNGTIEVKSVKGEGTVFTIKIYPPRTK